MENKQTELYTVNETAQIYKVHPRTVRRWIASGTIPALKIGREYRIPSDQLRLDATGPKLPN